MSTETSQPEKQRIKWKKTPTDYPVTASNYKSVTYVAMRITEGEERETVIKEIVEGMNRYKFSKINANHQIIGPGRSKNSKQEIPNNPQIGTS